MDVFPEINLNQIVIVSKMQKLKILNTREIKQIKVKLKEQFDYDYQEDYAFLLNNKDKLYVVNKDLSRLDLEKLRVDKYGMYFGELKGELRLSMEAAWLIGKKAKTNIIEINETELKKYFLGEDLDKELPGKNRFILLKFNQEIISCAKYKDQKILNYLPKIHRSKEVLV